MASEEQVGFMLPYMIQDWAQREPERHALTFVDIAADGRFKDETRSYGQLWDNGRRLAAALIDAGMGEDDRFAIVAHNHAPFVDAMVASGIVNTTFVPIDPRAAGDKLKFMLEFAECSGVIVGEEAAANLAAVLPRTDGIEWVWLMGADAHPELPQARAVSELLAAEVPELAIRAQTPDQEMQMLYTSGTTGDPKAIVGPYQRFGAIASLGDAVGMGAGNVLYTGLSLTHANAQLITLGNGLKHGSPCVISRRFTKSRLWDICREYGCTQFNLLGGMTTAIYSEPEKPDDADNPVKMVLSAGMPPAIWKKFEKRFGLDVYEFYGTAEGGVSMNPPGVGPIGSMGKPPASLVAKVVDDNDNECPPGEVGELIFQNADGSCPPVTYYKEPEKSQKKMRGGWFRTGDMCHTDADGWLYFDYREGDAIRHNGDFVDPGHVQKEIAEHPQVDDVFVYGVPAKTGVPGEKDVVAAVVPYGEADPQSVFAHCRERLKGNFVPTYVQMLDEIPKTASEKPQERFCVEAFENNPASVYTEQR